MKHCRVMWSPNEDKKLTDLINILGTEDWNRIAAFIPNKTVKQCKERWRYYLDPNINCKAYTIEEDKRLLMAVEMMGTKWTKIAQYFDHRTPYALKNRYNVLKRHQNKIPKNQKANLAHEMIKGLITIFDNKEEENLVETTKIE